MVIELVQELGPWTWMVVGVALLALEIAAPGTFFLWFGVAAIIVGVLALFIEMPWQAELLIFVVLAAVVVFVGRRYFSRSAEQPAAVDLNQRGRRLVGTIVVLSEPVVDGRGRVRIDDTTWRVVGPNMPSGTRVRIVSADAAVLTVRAEDGG